MKSKSISTKVTGEKKKERIKCDGCGKAIKIDDLGGVIGRNGKQYWFHDCIVCMIELRNKGIL